MQWLLRFDKVEIYPGIGNPAGSFGGAYPLRFTKRLEMTAHGLVLDNSAHHAAAGASVDLKLGSGVQQTVIADSEGYYRFAPFKTLAGSWKVASGTSGDVTLSSGLTDRKYRWAGLASNTALVAGPTAIVADKTGRLYIANVDDTNL